MPRRLPAQAFPGYYSVMIWRVAAVLAVLFWAVMSGLLVRDVYFPEASRFAVVPPMMVMNLFLRQAETFGTTLHLYHQHEKIGHADLQVSRRNKPNNVVMYDLIAHGVVEQVEAGSQMHSIAATWSIGCSLADAERWQHLTLKASFPQQDASMHLSWNESQPSPEVQVKQGDRVVMNSQDAKMMMGMASGKGGAMAVMSMLGGGLPKTLAGDKQETMTLQAREGLITLAGRQRKCFVVTLPILGVYDAKMIFTEAGELARIDLPDDYVLLEPTIHGLQDAAR